MQKVVRPILFVVCGLIAAMWVYAFGFAPRESFNRINDDAWKARAQARCLQAREERFAYQDLTKMDPTDAAAMRRKADIVDKATDSLEAAIDDIAKDLPADAKGRALVPQWIADYRVLIGNRREFAEQLRSSTRRPYFAESEKEGVPISEPIGKFARENEMNACQPPTDLSV